MNDTNMSLIQDERDAKNKPVKYILIGLISFIAIALIGLAYWQYRAIISLNAQISSLTTTRASLVKVNGDLGSKNTDLKRAITGLQNEVTLLQSTSSSQQSKSDVPSPVASMEVGSVKVIDASTFSAPGEVQLSGRVLAVYVTIKNLTGSIQQYTSLDFHAITDAGEAVAPRVYPGPAGQNVWNNSQLAPQGSKEVALLFDPALKLGSLEWSPTGSTTPLVASLPPVR